MRAINIPILASIFIVLISCGSNNSTKSTTSKSELKTTILAKLDFWKSYRLLNADFGTETIVTIKDGKRIMKTNGLPNHPTGDFPTKGNPNTISAQNLEYSFPLEPKYTGEATWAREPGIALNGVKFEPETAERFICESGEHYRVEAFQDLIDLGLDFNNAHVQPTGAYHYHGAPKGLIEALDNGEDIILIGFANDGFPIYYSKSGQYKPSYRLAEISRTGEACSYANPHSSMDKELQNTQPDGTFVSDWEYVAELGNLDECNGIEYSGSYSYFVTDDYPYVGRCLKGEFSQRRPGGPQPGGHTHPHPHKR